MLPRERISLLAVHCSHWGVCSSDHVPAMRPLSVSCGQFPCAMSQHQDPGIRFIGIHTMLKLYITLLWDGTTAAGTGITKDNAKCLPEAHTHMSQQRLPASTRRSDTICCNLGPPALAGFAWRTHSLGAPAFSQIAWDMQPTRDG